MKMGFVKELMITVLVSSLISTAFIVTGLGAYPGPDEDVNDQGLGGWYKLESKVKGYYDEGTYDLYEDVSFSSERSANWPYTLIGNMSCHYQTSEWDIGEYEFGTGVNYYAGSGYGVWVYWIQSWTSSKFNFFGYVYTVSATAYSHAWPM